MIMIITVPFPFFLSLVTSDCMLLIKYNISRLLKGFEMKTIYSFLLKMGREALKNKSWKPSHMPPIRKVENLTHKPRCMNAALFALSPLLL